MHSVRNWTLGWDEDHSISIPWKYKLSLHPRPTESEYLGLGLKNLTKPSRFFLGMLLFKNCIAC